MREPTSTTHSATLGLILSFALATPTLLAYNFPLPSATLLNQLLYAAGC